MPNKAKGKGTSKEELEEELLKYKQVQPSGYLIINAPKTEEMLLQYEKVFNGYTPIEEREKTEYESSRDDTDKLFPCSLSEQQPFLLEPNSNFILHRSLTLTKPIINEEMNENEVILIEKNSPSELQKRWAVIGSYNGTHSNLFEDFGTERIHIPYKFKFDTTVEKEIPPVEEGEEAKEKTPEEIQEEIVQKFRSSTQKILESHQKVLDLVIEENIEVVREEVEAAKVKAEQDAQQEEENQQKDDPQEEEIVTNKNEEEVKEAEAEGELAEGEVEEEIIKEEIGFHPTVVSEIYSTWKTNERSYTKNMLGLFSSVRKQHSKILEGIEEMKEKFREFLMKPDKKQEKLEYFIESFNKFTEEFPELRPDEQTKEELNNRWDILTEEFWDIIEWGKDESIQERKRLMNSGWIEHELQQLTIKAQQFFTSEIKRCINSLNFVHSFYLSSLAEKPLSEYENKFPQKFSLSLLDESSSESENIELPKVEDPNNSENFPFLDCIFEKGISILNEIDQGSLVYSQSNFEILNSIQIEKEILLYRLLAIRSWTIRGLKDIRHKINEAYDLLDDWIIEHVKNENDNANKVVDLIRDIIETTEPIDTEFKISRTDIDVEGKDQIQFIETIDDKSFISGKSTAKFSLNQAKDYLNIFKILCRDEFIDVTKAKSMLISQLKLAPDLVPPKWRDYPLSYVEGIVDSLKEEDQDVINWRKFITFWILQEAFQSMVDRDSVANIYKVNLKKTLENELEEYIPLEKFLEVSSWYDNYLSWKKKEEVFYEEDKQEIDQEVKDMKKLLYSINISENGLLHIDNYVGTILSLWSKV